MRVEYTGEITVSWDDPLGGTHYASTRCVDVSEGGVSLQMYEAMPLRAYVTFRIDGLKLAGRATVRHCSKRGAYFRIGLEFSGGLRFVMPQTIAAKN